jgi:hypothetical protein
MSRLNEGRAKTRMLNIWLEYTETLDELVPRTIMETLMNDIRDDVLGITCDGCTNFVSGACNQSRPVEHPFCQLRMKVEEWLVNYDADVIPVP